MESLIRANHDLVPLAQTWHPSHEVCEPVVSSSMEHHVDEPLLRFLAVGDSRSFGRLRQPVGQPNVHVHQLLGGWRHWCRCSCLYNFHVPHSPHDLHGSRWPEEIACCRRDCRLHFLHFRPGSYCIKRNRARRLRMASTVGAEEREELPRQ